MSEEEKKAIEYLKKNCIPILKYDNFGNLERIQYYGTFEKVTILNLIKKLQKEIEHEKNQRKFWRINFYKQQKEIEELKLDLEEMTKSNNHKEENWIHKNALNSYVRKDKIREKIKEYHNFYIECPEEYRKLKLRTVEVVLKELLEEN